MNTVDGEMLARGRKVEPAGRFDLRMWNRSSNSADRKQPSTAGVG